MPSTPDGSSTPSLSPTAAPAALVGPAAVQLAQANRALWIATLSLMTAFMQTPAPAHRYLLSRRIARNFETLSGQDCFDTGCRASFGRLAKRWQARSEQFAPDQDGGNRGGLLRRLVSW
jgi:hypothetical protein